MCTGVGGAAGAYASALIPAPRVGDLGGVPSRPSPGLVGAWESEQLNGRSLLPPSFQLTREREAHSPIFSE